MRKTWPLGFVAVKVCSHGCGKTRVISEWGQILTFVAAATACAEDGGTVLRSRSRQKRYSLRFIESQEHSELLLAALAL